MRNIVTVSQLLAVLKDAEERGLGELEVRIAYQPSYPLELCIEGWATDQEAAQREWEDEDNGEHEAPDAVNTAPTAFYLTTPRQNDYLQAASCIFDVGEENASMF